MFYILCKENQFKKSNGIATSAEKSKSKKVKIQW